MFIGVYKLEGKIYNNIYDNNRYGWDAYHSDTFSPDTEFIGILEFKTHGKTYEEIKYNLEDLAKEYQLYYSHYSWSWGEIATITNYFYTMGKRYGLLKEFRENGIC
jgi:hypothetical protein